MTSNNRLIIEYGDFQTPDILSNAVCELLISKNIGPASIIEPTFGIGSFLISSLLKFTSLKKMYGLEINPKYVEISKKRISEISHEVEIDLHVGDFFLNNWNQVISQMPDPILIIGNPPWVTNANLSSLQSKNLPQKTNFKNFKGLDAITGRSNFDISEWMIIKLILETKKNIYFAMLCKTSVARNSLEYFWKNNIKISSSEIYTIDAKKHFSAAVDACLLVISLRDNINKSCRVYSGLFNEALVDNFGYRDGLLVANLDSYDRTKHLGGESILRWRSGIKHDSSKVMELSYIDGNLANKLGEHVNIEGDFLYPMLKSSDIANADFPIPKRFMLVTQKHPGEDTSRIKKIAPLTWEYLENHSEYLDNRKSSIYKNSPRFSIFGVGNYSFLPWKIAISGLYKSINFSLVSPYQEKPTVLDDTCYFLSFNTESQARLIFDLLNSDLSKDFFSSFIFWDNKRPITALILKKLDISKLAIELDKDREFKELIQSKSYHQSKSQQLTLLEEFEIYKN